MSWLVILIPSMHFPLPRSPGSAGHPAGLKEATSPLPGISGSAHSTSRMSQSVRCIPRTCTLHPPAIEIGRSGAHDLNWSNRIDFRDFTECWEFSFLLDDMVCKCDSWTCLWGSEDGTQPKNKTDREVDSRHREDILTPSPTWIKPHWAFSVIPSSKCPLLSMSV